ncbi:MAG: efflux RND transporter periplasmic adaptor subunit, partial [Calditrichota bacterium]
MKFTERIRTLFSKEYRFPLIILLLAAFGIGYLLNSESSQESTHPAHNHQVEATTWTCSMHPQIQQPGSGQCPICGMDLIPIENATDEELGPRELKLSMSAQKRANIQTAIVKREPASLELRLSGKLYTDETRVKYIAARAPGRIDRLYVDYQGTRVRKGDHLVQLYSPRLISAQEEYLQAYKTSELRPTASLGLDTEQTLSAAREKLKQL